MVARHMSIVKIQVFASLAACACLSTSASAGLISKKVQGKIVSNQTDFPMSSLELRAVHEVEGGRDSGPFPVRADGTFTIEFDGLLAQSAVVVLPNGVELEVSDNRDSQLKKELQNLSILQMDGVAATFRLKSGGDASQWLSAQAPNHDVSVALSDGLVLGSTTSQALPLTITTANFSIPTQYRVFDSALALKTPITLKVSVSEDVSGPAVDGSQIAQLAYTGLPTRDILSHFSTIELDPSAINTDMNDRFSGTIFPTGFNNMQMDATFRCENGVLSGTATFFSYIFDGSQSSPVQATIDNGRCGSGPASFSVLLPVTHNVDIDPTPVTTPRQVEFQVQYVTSSGLSFTMSLDAASFGSGYLKRGAQ